MPNPSFADLAEHWRRHALHGQALIGRKAFETTERDEHNLDQYVLPRWGQRPALEIYPVEVEAWFEQLASKPQGRRKQPLKWPTIGKIESCMSQVYGHAQRHRLIAATMECNPFRPAQFGGVRCKTVSGYEARVVTPEQMIAILAYLDTPVTQLEWTLALTCAATAARGEEVFGLKWLDIDWAHHQIHIRRAWSKGKETRGKTANSLAPVPMHGALAEYLLEWRKESLYSREGDWVFPSYRSKGRTPRVASTCSKDYLRPAAVQAGVIGEKESVRFGWHNLRHSLATFFGSQEVPVNVIQKTLRHRNLAMTARYTHAVNHQQVEAQGMYLESLQLADKAVQ